MLTYCNSKSLAFCDGLSRRNFLRVGSLFVGGLGLADLLRIEAQGSGRTKLAKSVIMVYLHGGPSHIDMFDMKPDAPVEFRGEFRPIRTNVIGLEICELMPRLATVADKMSVIRNVSFMEYTDGHNPPLVYTGFRTSTANPTHRPTFGSVVSRFGRDSGQGGSVRDMPPYVAFDGVDNKPVRSSDFLGVAHRAFVPGEQIETLGPIAGMTLDRMTDRRNLLESFNALRRTTDDNGGNLVATDVFTTRALDMITTPRARDAFDISQEPESTRALYGEGGVQFLKARRLVEAGVPVVTLTANSESHTWDTAGPWDHHGSVFTGLRKLLPAFDQSLHALITDLAQRGLDQDVAVVVWGEMGRTPKVSKDRAGGGRDHWHDSSFAVLAGGGWPMGQVIGKTDAWGSAAIGTPYTPQNVLATLYAHLGIDATTTLLDFTGRPQPLLDDCTPIKELL
jgi:hypothetical protein